MTLPVSVVIPTIGRQSLLEDCVASVLACRPPPAEVVVVDQSEAGLRASKRLAGARIVRDLGSGRPRAVNVGLRAAANEIVLFTDDDCSVREDWALVGYQLIDEHPTAVACGRVLPAGDPEGIPSTKTDRVRAVYEGGTACHLLYGGNLASRRSELLAVGGFDERIVPSAEDNELCYRWLRSGRTLIYEPELTVWHRDWRSSAEMRQLYHRYGVGQGVFLGLGLREGDPAMLRFLSRDLLGHVRPLLRALARRELRRSRAAHYLRGLLIGLGSGLRGC